MARALSLCLFVSVSVVSVGSLSAQEYAEATSVVLVEVPVNVTRGGEPVLGLTAENFELQDEGKKQEITGFDVIDLSAPMSAAEVGQLGVSSRRHFVFVFDLSFSEPGTIFRARQAARDLVRSSLHPTDLVAVATYSNRAGPQMILNFTSDRRQVEEAFTTLGLIRQRRRIDDPLGIVLRAPAIGEDRDDGEAQRRAEGAAGIDAETEIMERLEGLVRDSEKADLRRRVDIFAQTFGFLAELLAPLEGRKHVVFLSQGFDASALFGTTDQERLAEIQDAVELGQLWNVDSDERFGQSQALNDVYQLIGDFRRADATIHSIDISRLSAETGSAARGRQDGLFVLSSETGGEFYRNYNDLSQAMGEMLERTSVTYVLAFQPTELQPSDTDFRRLRVRLKGVPRGARVSAREGYYPPRPSSSLSADQQRLRSAQKMASGPGPGDPGFDVLTMPFSTDTERAYVPLLVQIPGSRLTQGRSVGRLPLEIYAYAADESGVVRDYFAEALTFDLSQVGGNLATTGVKFFGHLDLEPGDYAVRVMVKNGVTGDSEVDVVPLTVPDFAATHLAVMPPLFPEDVERWVVVRESRDRAALREVEYPFVFKTESFLPAIRPAFQPQQVVAVSLVAAKSTRGSLEVGSLLMGADGTPLPGTFLRVLERESDAAQGMERMIGVFEVPNLPSGDYSLVVTMSDPDSGDVQSGTLEFTLGAAADAAGVFGAPVWMPDLTEIVGRLGPTEPSAQIVKIDQLAAESGYEEVLRLLADGRQMSAVLALADLEAGLVIPDDPMSSLKQAANAQRRVLDRLARQDPELLLPAILLHREVYSQYRLRRESFLSVHARNTTLELIDEYAKRSSSPGAKALASRILTGMASEVHQSGAHVSTMRMFRRAVELDESNGVALTGLGFLLETTGREDRIPTYEDAAQMFERAVRVAPGLWEARLRLAVNLRRLEREAEAERQLKVLLGQDGVPDWIVSLAFQELARLYLHVGNVEQARVVLEQGLQRLPEEPKLALQLAYVYERSQRQRQARQAIDRAAGRGTAARYHYLQVPRLTAAPAVDEWRERAESRLPALADALGPVGAGVGR